MSYTRDKDAHTRGVGAIAATDGPASTRRRALAARMMARRDRTSAAWTMGPRGGAVGLGMVSRGANYGRPGFDAPDKNAWVPPPLPPQHGGGKTPTPPAPFVVPGMVSTNPGGSFLLPGKVAGGGGNVGTNVGQGFGPAAPAPTAPPPGGTMIDPITGTTTGTTGGGSSGGGGGGGGGGGITTGGGTAPTFDTPLVPDDVAPSSSVAASMSNTEKIVLAAAAIGGLYLLFGRKRSST